MDTTTKPPTILEFPVTIPWDQEEPQPFIIDVAGSGWAPDSVDLREVIAVLATMIAETLCFGPLLKQTEITVPTKEN